MPPRALSELDGVVLSPPSFSLGHFLPFSFWSLLLSSACLFPPTCPSVHLGTCLSVSLSLNAPSQFLSSPFISLSLICLIHWILALTVGRLGSVGLVGVKSRHPREKPSEEGPVLASLLQSRTPRHGHTGQCPAQSQGVAEPGLENLQGPGSLPLCPSERKPPRTPHWPLARQSWGCWPSSALVSASGPLGPRSPPAHCALGATAHQAGLEPRHLWC